MTDREAIVALNLLPKIGPVRVRRLLEAFGDPVSILGAPKDRLMRVDGIGAETAGILHGWQDHADPAAEIREATERGISIITQDDATDLIQRMRDGQFGVTDFAARGIKGNVRLIFTVIQRRDYARLVRLIEETHPRAFISTSDVRSVREGFIPGRSEG